ncbi:hypothetical protein [Actinomadura hibisca]|uniref:hypothetical protein n=1 Tax=Actinomadura hibisca TaxID=68565 RepID=UPI00082EF808|nr:hypothetical protein [Actinomadura hibisca]
MEAPITANHPDPIAEGFNASGQRLVQLLYVAAVVQQKVAQQITRKQAAKEAQAREQEELADRELKALLDEARAKWTPAHDRKWLKQADLLQVGEAWAAAIPYAGQRPDAASAVHKCEERLRNLHPYAMRHYDQARAEGHGPLEAMREAAPFFARDPRTHEGASAAKPTLSEGTGLRWAAAEHGPGRAEFEQARQERRAGQIIQRLQEDLRSNGCNEMDAVELRTVLGAATNLPEHVITAAVQPYAGPGPTAVHTPTGSRSPADVSADGFPFDARQVLRMNAGQPFEQPRQHRQEPTIDRDRHLDL